jgi:hypothetical protein
MLGQETRMMEALYYQKRRRCQEEQRMTSLTQGRCRAVEEKMIQQKMFLKMMR